MITVINQPPVVCLSENPAILEIETSLDALENIHVIVQPEYIGANIEIASDVLYPSPLGRALCNLSEYIRSAFYVPYLPATKFTFPDTPADCRLIFDQAKIYTITIKEGSGFPATYTETVIQPLYVVPGKIPQWIRNHFYKHYSSFWNWIQTVHPFLTLAPLTVKTTLAQTRKLYWLCWFFPSGIQELLLRIDFKFSDFTTGSWDKYLITDDDLQQYGIYEIHTGYAALAIDGCLSKNYPGKIVTSYSVTLMAAGADVSETRIYNIDSSQHEAEREFAFRNSVGGYDTIMFTGEGQTLRDHNKEILNNLSAGSNYPLLRAINSSVEEKTKVNTGWLTTLERAYLSELIDSTEVFQISADGLIPVIFGKQQIVSQKDNDTLQSLQLEYQPVANNYYENGI